MKVRMFEWGVIAGYMNTPELVKKNRSWMANARSEKVLDKKAYWSKIRKNRCVIPVNGFYEHREVKGIKNKIPYFIHRKDQPLFFIAGLYNYAPVPDEHGEQIGTFAVITREANPLMKTIHNGGENAGRMPLILQNNMVEEWLSKDLLDIDIQNLLDYSIPSEKLEAWPVFSVRGSKIRQDGKERYEKYEYAGLPELGEDGNGQSALF